MKWRKRTGVRKKDQHMTVGVNTQQSGHDVRPCSKRTHLYKVKTYNSIYMSYHIKPCLVKSYLSGICNQLESFYPNVWEVHHYKLIIKTLLGVTKLWATLTICKQPLLCKKLASVSMSFSLSISYDNKLFLSILLTSFHRLMRLGENIWLDAMSLQDYRKVIMWSIVSTLSKSFSFLLSSHKADHLFEGNHILIY